MFIYTEKEVLSEEQRADLASGKADLRVVFKKAVDARLRIKQLTHPSKGIPAKLDPKIMAFFVNPALFELPKQANTPGSASRGKDSLVPERVANDPADQLFNDISCFDIRKGICSNLVNPDPALNQIGTSSAQRSLIGQYERSELLFDVYQDLDPYEVRVRINAFEKENYRMLSSANLTGPELKVFLRQD